jgi:hypothetical protein
MRTKLCEQCYFLDNYILDLDPTSLFQHHYASKIDIAKFDFQRKGHKIEIEIRNKRGDLIGRNK